MPTILITDDQVGCAEVVWHILHDLGCEMLYVEEKLEALAKLPHIRPDLVITDLGSPGLNGFDFIHGVREFDQHIPIVVLSGVLDDQSRSRAMQLGASHCFNKPFDVCEFRGVVRQILMDKGVF